MENRPRNREKKLGEASSGIKKKGSATGNGPMRPNGSVGGGSRVPGTGGQMPGGGKRSNGGGGKSPMSLLLVVAVLLLGGGGGMSLLNGDSDQGTGSTGMESIWESYASQSSAPSGSWNYTSSVPDNYQQVNSDDYYSKPETWSYATVDADTATVDTSVASGARTKYTNILGQGKDVTTVMIYMCGTDLESRSGMGTNDLQEIASAKYGDNVNVIVYTGGCRSWRIQGISNRTNQIFQLKNGRMTQLADMGNKVMTKPETLTEFIRYCAENFPANRNDLILWDHGGGSVSGYGYDEKYAEAGSMDLNSIDKALTDAGVKFDFVGFDACLMATTENALMLDKHADYLIASEETEPGIGWYYTKWLDAYGADPSMDTLELGKTIVDGFVEECDKKCRGQLTTLSVVDLAELAHNVPDKLKAFSQETSEKIKNKQYKEVALARQNSREFAQSNKIDQVDVVDFVRRIDSDASKELADSIKSAIKYNRTSYNMTNANGLSIYFPNQKLSIVKQAVSLNDSLGLGTEFNNCIKDYASVQGAGQSVAMGMGSTGNPYDTLAGYNTYQGSAGNDMAAQILNELFGSGMAELFGAGGASLYGGRALDGDELIDYIADNQLDASKLVWEETEDGQMKMTLSEDQWDMIYSVELNMFVDNGEGYADLGTDTIFSFDEEGKLVACMDHDWLAIDGHPVAYYHTDTVDFGEEYSISGYVPCMLNGVRTNLILTFDQDNPYGYVAGTTTAYTENETDTIAKTDRVLEAGDEIEFLCDFYNNDGTFEGNYLLENSITVSDPEKLEITNVPIDGDVCITYKFTDIYGQEYWSMVQ